MPTSRRPLRALLCLAALLAACAEERDAVPNEPGARAGPPHARWEMVEDLRAAGAAERHPSDGGGRAWIEADESQAGPAVAGAPTRVALVYEVGPLGIARGGVIHFQVSPFWGWSTPQVEIPEAPGFTRVEPDADDVDLEIATLDQQLLGITVTGRALVEGERIRIVYGAGPAGATADRYAERDSRFFLAVDGDGDGVRAFLPNPPGIDVAPRAPARMTVTLPTLVRPGEEFRVAVAVLDEAGNTGVAVGGEIVFDEVPPGIELPRRIPLGPEDGGNAVVVGVARETGLVRLSASGPNGLSAEANPMLVSADGPRVLWADLHGHSALSDGTGTAEDYFRYARDVAGLDVVALTDHDHWGLLPLDENPGVFDEIARRTREFHAPGRFVTLLGYEWTSWIHGHRHVLYFDDEGPLLSSIDPAYESPVQLWRALEGRRALTFAHHSAGGPIPTNWDIPPDPHFEPVTEIVSVHGSSEALDSPGGIYSPVPGNFVRDALDRGFTLGFVGSGDSHDGHPGLAHLAAPSGGLAAILSEERTREGVLEAIRARRVYATSGPRILLQTALGLHRMGSVVDLAGEALTENLFVRVVAPSPLERVDLIRSGAVVDSLPTEGQRDVSLHRSVEDLGAGEYLYVRAVQENGLAAWSSPIFFR